MSKTSVAASTQSDAIKKAFKVYNFILGKGGEIDFPELLKHPSPLKSFSGKEALEWLNEFKDLNDKEDVIEKPCFVVKRNLEGRSIVRALIKTRLCQNYETNGACKHEPKCLQFHICKGFLEGRCADSTVCSRSHDLKDKGNLNKIQKYRLEHLDNANARKVIMKNLPFVCEGYSKQECSNPLCEQLHVCPRLVMMICEDKEDDCPLNLSHDLQSPHNKRIFKEFFVPVKYLLCNILVSKTTKVVVTDKEGKRKGKVNKLNNLDTENDDDNRKQGEAQEKLGEFQPNILSKVPESPRAMASKSREKGKKDGNTVKNEELNIKPGLLPTPVIKESLQRSFDAQNRSSLPMRREERQRPVPLMGLPIMYPEFPPRPDFQQAFQNMLFPRDLEFTDQSIRGRQGQQRGGNGGLSRGGRKWKSMDHFHGLPPSDTPLNGNEGSKQGGGGARGVRGRGTWRGRGRGIVLSEREEALNNVKSLATNPLKEDVTAEPSIKESRKKSRRPRHRKRKPRSNSADPEEDEEDSDGENMGELKENSMEFKLEDEDDQQDLIDLDDGSESTNLVDLNFEPDAGLSQASEAQALWDIFSQDQLYDSLPDKDLDLISNPDDSCQSNEPSSVSVASVRAVFNCIVKEFGGCVSFSEISTRDDLFHPGFQDHEKWFKQHSKSFLRIYNPEGQLVEIKTFALHAKMCFKYCGKGCNNKSCPFFHVCEEFIARGRCDTGRSCKKNHSFSDNHNKHIAAKFFPKDHFDDQQLQVLIQSSTPQVCLDYNNGKCLVGRNCTKIHICKNYGKKRCPKGACHLQHNKALLTPATKSILQRFKVKGPPEVNGYILAKTLLVCEDVPVKKLQVFEKKTRKRTESSIPTAASADSAYHISSNLGSHICLKFLLNRCQKGPKCTDHHCPMPYQWVYMVDNKWHMLIEDENLNLERFFCNEILSDAVITLTLNCSSSSSSAQAQQNESFFYKVDFTEMHIKPLDDQGPSTPLKRLSTESMVHIPDCPLATMWRWFWKEREGFTEYKPKGVAKDPSSATIERHFLEGHGMHDFHIEPYAYRLYFRKKPMLQKNLDPKYYTEREVCRRPEYVSKQQFESIKRRTCKLPNEDSRELPHLWIKMAECQEFLLYQLRSQSKEFKEMELKFLASIADKKVTIHSIDRVQNPFMMEKYLRKKNHMQKRSNASNGQIVDERFLFHGTSHRNIRPICKQNFDWRLYGEVTGNIHGEGAYFARESSLSDCYCPQDEDSLRYIFIAKVLVGSFTKGDKKYKRPPHKDSNDLHSDLYDSCVDTVENPRIFVVFDVDQYYPAYLVTYKREDVGDLSSLGATVGSISKRPAPPRPSSSSYGYGGSHMPSSPSYTSSTFPSSPYMRTSTTVSHSGAASSSSLSSAAEIVQAVMAQQVEGFSHSAAAKKSNQNNCSVM